MRQGDISDPSRVDMLSPEQQAQFRHMQEARELARRMRLAGMRELWVDMMLEARKNGDPAPIEADLSPEIRAQIEDGLARFEAEKEARRNGELSIVVDDVPEDEVPEDEDDEADEGDDEADEP